MGYFSLTIIFGFPCSFWIVSINQITIVLALKGWYNAQKCAYLVSRSTTIMMTLFHSKLGKHVIKYTKTSSQHWLGIDKGCNRPRVLIVSTLFCWKSKHSTTNFWISDLSPSQKISFLTLWYAFKNTECRSKGEACNSKRRFCLNWEFLHRYKRSLYHSESFFQINISNVLRSCCNFWMSVHNSSSIFHSSLASII